MSYRHKSIEIIHTTTDVGTGVNGTKLFQCILDHVGKINHKIIATFSVDQPNPNMIHDIKLFLMNERQVIEWLFTLIGTSSSWVQMPKNYVHFGGQTKEGTFEKNVAQSIHAYFVLDNRYSTLSSKRVTLVVREEWDELEVSLDLVTTIPPHDRTLNSEVKKIINDSRTNLKIISPYIDLLLLSDLLKMHQQGIIIQIVTREKDEFAGKDKKDTFEHIKKNLTSNHKTNKNIHSRIILRDEQEALVSSADLTYDSMIAQFNVGIVTSDTDVIRKLLSFFNSVWEKS